MTAGSKKRALNDREISELIKSGLKIEKALVNANGY